MRPRHRVAVLLLAGLLSGATGCVDPTGPTVALRDLATAQRRWRDNGYQDYRYTLRVSCFCGDVATAPVEITVFRGNIGVRYLDTGEPADTLWFGRYATMERLFATIAEAANRDGATLNAEYDPALGYPRTAFMDPLPHAADDELGIAVTDVVPLRVR